MWLSDLLANKGGFCVRMITKDPLTLVGHLPTIVQKGMQKMASHTKHHHQVNEFYYLGSCSFLFYS